MYGVVAVVGCRHSAVDVALLDSLNWKSLMEVAKVGINQNACMKLQKMYTISITAKIHSSTLTPTHADQKYFACDFGVMMFQFKTSAGLRL